MMCASLFIQLFQLPNPLLLQQPADNNQSIYQLFMYWRALVTAAFFQGLLTAVRTWLLIDTTDRMDLVLGHYREILRLPLRFLKIDLLENFLNA